jgi:hydrogenase nickel insertion protein HypA
MHEFGIAQSVVDFALSEVERKKASAVRELRLSVGELMQVDTRALSSALRVLMTGPRLKGCRLSVAVEKASFVCARCGASWRMKDALKQLEGTPSSLRVNEPDGKELPLHFLPSLYQSFLHCPKCGSADIATSGGEGIQLRRLVLK